MKKIYAITALCLTLFSTKIFAQTTKENLEKGIETYNALREYSRTLTPETTTEENIEDINNRVEQGTILLDKVVKTGTAEQIKVARYFKTNFRYELGYMRSMNGDNEESYVVFKAVENDITAYKSSDFPMTYEYNSKIYKITWENFAVIQAEYFTSMGEMSYNIGKYEDAYTMTKNAVAHKNTTNWLSYIAVNKILDIRAKKKSLVSDDEYYEFSLKSMKAYTTLSNEDKKIVIENNYPTLERGYKIFNSLIESKTTLLNLPTTIGEAAQILMGGNENEKAAKFFTYALKNNWGTSTLWKNEVLPTAKAANDNALGLAVLGRLVTGLNATDCDNMESFSRDYAQFGDATKSTELKKKSENCRQQKEEEAKKIAEKQRKEEERRAREQRKATRDAHFFVGINAFPLFSSPRHWGGVINFGAKKTMVELSFLSVAKKKENYFDLELREIKDAQEHKWDGFFSHVAFKFSKNSFKRFATYSGFLLGYNQRAFEPFSTNVTNTLTQKIQIKAFEPTNKQYIGMLNFGVMRLKGLGFDAYMGLGAAYNQFDGGNSEVWNKDGFTIEDKMVANRKPNYFSFIMRIGLSVGFGW
jgi:hypothetical protein